MYLNKFFDSIKFFKSQSVLAKRMAQLTLKNLYIFKNMFVEIYLYIVMLDIKIIKVKLLR